jgi:hypothetical protein
LICAVLYYMPGRPYARFLETSGNRFPPRSPPPLQVDNIGDVTITNDGATILKQLEVEHPAAKVLVDLAELQDTEVGDGTTSVVIIAAELLRASTHAAAVHWVPGSYCGSGRQ